MKASELRLKNIVSYSDLNYEIWGIGIDKAVIDSEENDSHLTVKLQYIQPITLTQEWLLKFGWGKDEYDSTYIDNVSLKQAVLYYDVNNKMFLIESNRDTIEFNHIHYVHQLQNLYFALTGEELTLYLNNGKAK